MEETEVKNFNNSNISNDSASARTSIKNITVKNSKLTEQTMTITGTFTQCRQTKI